jgi:hypothetical protein
MRAFDRGQLIPDLTDEIRTSFPGITRWQISMLRFDSAGLAGVRERVISTLSRPRRAAAMRHQNRQSLEPIVSRD